MRFVIVCSVWLALTPSLLGAEPDCVLHGYEHSAFTVRPDDGPPFEINVWRGDFAIHIDSSPGPYPVDVASPLVFHGFAAGPIKASPSHEVTIAETITVRQGASIAIIG